MAELLPRLVRDLLEELASALRIVIVNGPRQSGKTTLLRQYQRAHGGHYRTLDNMLLLTLSTPTTRAAAVCGGCASGSCRPLSSEPG